MASGYNYGRRNTGPMMVIDTASYAFANVITAPTYTLEIRVAIGGTTDPPAASYPHPKDEIVTVTAIPLVDFGFRHWEFDGQLRSANPIILTMTQDIVLTPVFKAPGEEDGGLPILPIVAIVGGGAAIAASALTGDKSGKKKKKKS